MLFLALSAIVMAQLDMWLKALLMVATLLLFVRSWVRRSELGGEAVELRLRPDGSWLVLCGGETISVALHGQSMVTRHLLLLCFKELEGRRDFSYLMWRAESPPQLYRRLSVYLRLYAFKTAS